MSTKLRLLVPLVVGILAASALGVAELSPSSADTADQQLQAKRDVEATEAAIHAADIANAPIPPSRDPIPPLVGGCPIPTGSGVGVIDVAEGNFPFSGGFNLTTQTEVTGPGPTVYDVYAGGSDEDPIHGVIHVLTRSPDVCTPGMDPVGRMDSYFDPAHGGPLALVSAIATPVGVTLQLTRNGLPVTFLIGPTQFVP